MLSNRLGRGVTHTFTILRTLLTAKGRALLNRMVAFSRRLPHQFDQPLPAMMARLTPPSTTPSLPYDEIRRLADAVAAWHLCSPLGLCLRRSLLRYYFLREAGLPVQIVFGARLKQTQAGSGIGGHAWLTLDGAPYHEHPGDCQDFAQIYVYP